MKKNIILEIGRIKEMMGLINENDNKIIDEQGVKLATPPAVTLPIKLETLFDASAPSAAHGLAPAGNASLIDCTH